jgi:hypothetical protein
MRLTIFFAFTILGTSLAYGARPAVVSELPAKEADAIAIRTGKAPLIVIAQAVKVWDKGIAECRIISVIKGKFEGRGKGRTFRVRFSKVLGGVWPEKGVTGLYFLRPAIGGQTSVFNRKTIFELTSEKHGLVAPTGDTIAVIKLAAAGQYVLSDQRAKMRLKVPAPDTMFGTMLSATYVAVGTIEETVYSSNSSTTVAARLTCRLEAIFKGRIRPGKVIIDVPAVPGRAADPGKSRKQIKAGPAVLMFVKEKGGGLRLVSHRRGHFAIPDRDKISQTSKQLTELVAKEKELRRMGLIGDPSKRTSIAKTLKLWQTSWNANETQNVVSCYSRRSKWRREWDSGFSGKKRITKVVETFGAGDSTDSARAQIFISLVAIKEIKKGSQALATVTINVVTRDQLVERRPAIMTFAYENGMWLILHEGN